MYNSEEYVAEFYERMVKSVKKITGSYEIIFVNDGSPDGSLQIAKRLLEIDNKIRIIDLSRNFGQHKAIMTGLAHAGGDLVFLIDCDLEEDPELLELFLEEYRRDGDADVIFGVQKNRKGNIIRRLPGALFYHLFNFLSDYKLPSNLTTVRLMSKRYVENLVRYRESELVIGGLWVITGFRQVPVPIDTRHKGASSYSFTKKMSLFFNSVTSFTSKPLVYICYIGFFISIISFISVCYLIIVRILYGTPILGYTSLIASIWLLGGIVIFSIGVVGVYLSRVFIEVKQRPYTIIRKIYER